ncbi:hypothetical protein Slin14017_G068960 [Septoria linicola]|nr:hypothetical protein Slin14017_G068960 [Septoria linicola]
MLTSTLLNYLALSTAALVTAADRRCYRSTTAVPHPALSCTPFAGICPMIICADEARPKATVTVPQNHAALVTECASIPTVGWIGYELWWGLRDGLWTGDLSYFDRDEDC